MIELFKFALAHTMTTRTTINGRLHSLRSLGLMEPA